MDLCLLVGALKHPKLRTSFPVRLEHIFPLTHRTFVTGTLSAMPNVSAPLVEQVLGSFSQSPNYQRTVLKWKTFKSGFHDIERPVSLHLFIF